MIGEVETDIFTSFHKASMLHSNNAKGGGMTGIISIDGAETDIPIFCLKASLLHSGNAI